MDKELYNLHLKAGNICGKERTCGVKQAYHTEREAEKGAMFHNNRSNSRHIVEPYPCAFCNKWHIGRVMSTKRLENICLKIKPRKRVTYLSIPKRS